jgi:integrase/recombinase XerD
MSARLNQQESFRAYLQLKGYSIATTKRYVQDAQNFKRWTEKENVEIEQVSYSDVLHYIQSKQNGVKQSTISRMVNSLKHYYNHLILINLAVENPTTQIAIKGIKRKKLYDILSKEELENLYHNFEQSAESKPKENTITDLVKRRNKVILGLMIYQGLNASELSRLTEKDLKLRAGEINISGSRKSNARELKLKSHQVMDMMEYTLNTRKEILAITEKETDHLFISMGTSSYFRSIINKLMQKLNKQSRKITSLQQIRASVITHWLKRYNLREVQYMAGHRYVSSTESYLVNDLDGLQEDISKFHPIG